MPRQPTGRPPGRPPGDRYGTAQQRLERARTLLPSLRAFPHLLRAVERVMAQPHQVVLHSPFNAHQGDVDLLHIYSPVERGQILSFTWWVHINRSRWSRRRKLAAVTLLSPLMLFSSAFFEEMTGIEAKSASRWMVRPEGMLPRRVTGSCAMRVVYLLLEAATRGDQPFRELVSDLVRAGEVPGAMASRLSGVPGRILLEPSRGLQFTPVGPDLPLLSVRPREELLMWLDVAGDRERDLMPQVYGQEWVRDLLPETLLKEALFTATPVPRIGESCYHLCIPGWPRPERAQALGRRYYQLLLDWERKYQLSSAPDTA